MGARLTRRRKGFVTVACGILVCVVDTLSLIVNVEWSDPLGQYVAAAVFGSLFGGALIAIGIVQIRNDYWAS